MSIILKSAEEIEKISVAGRILSECLELLSEAAQPGITTEVLDRGAEEFILEAGAKPAFKGFDGYQHTLCTSVNDVIAHGVPGPYEIKTGDLLSLDLGVECDGWIADAAITLPVGEVSDEAHKLIFSAQKALVRGVLQVREGNTVGDISAAIQQSAELDGLAVVTELSGHGIGRSLHEDPEVPNKGIAGSGPALREGMVLAIEPMIARGSGETVSGEDGWGLCTKDGSLSAHSEFTVAVTKRGPRVLTPWLSEKDF